METLASEPRKFWKVCGWARKRAKRIREADFFPALKTATGTLATSAQDKAKTLQQECFPCPGGRPKRSRTGEISASERG